MKVLLVLILTFNTTLSLAKDYRVAALYWSMDIEGQVAMRKGVEERAKLITKNTQDKIIIEPYVAGNGRDGTKKQIQQFYKVLKQKNPVDLVIIQPTDNSALIGPLQMANKLKVPVVAYDQYILGGELTSFITSNNYQAGKLNGEYIEALFPNRYEIKLILVEYPRVTSTIERVEGFIDALKKAQQNYKILKTYTAVEPEGGKKAGKQILKDFPKKNSIDAIFTINDGGGLSIVSALSEAKRNEIKIATIDGDPESIKNVLSGNLTVINSAQFCSQIGRESMQAGYDFLKKKKTAKRLLIPTYPVTQKTIKNFSGWEDNIPKAITLPWNKRKWNNKVQRMD